MAKTVIVGGPRTGKTTLGDSISPECAHTDDTIGLGWDQAIEKVETWLDEREVIEGVQAARALRKWLAGHPSGKPCERVVYLESPQAPQTRGQQIMDKGIRTVMSQIIPELERRGVDIERRG